MIHRSSDSFPRAVPGTSSQSAASREQRRRSRGLSSAIWLLIGVAVVLVIILAYYLSLTTRPEISDLIPAPNSSQPPGPVELSAIISSQRVIEDVRLSIDGESVEPDVQDHGDQEWLVHYQSVFERGEREVLLDVVDSAGRSSQHSWTFEASGDLIAPRLSIVAPPRNSVIPTGISGVNVHATTFAELGNAEITVNGNPVHTRVTESSGLNSEYSGDEDAEIFDWEINATTTFAAGTQDIEVVIEDIHGASSTLDWSVDSTIIESRVTAQYFPNSGHYAVEPFLTFWQERNGEEVFGPPVSPVLQASSGNDEQFYRYAWLEHVDGEVRLKLIGREIFGEPEAPPSRPPGSGWRLFDPTGHYIYGAIRDFWEEKGGLTIFGYPISQEFETDRGYAQYFERAMIEVVDSVGEETVQLAPIGERLYRQLAQQQQPRQSTP